MSKHTEVDGVEKLKAVCKLGLEGIVSKRLTSVYRSRSITGLAENQESKSTSSHTRRRWNILELRCS